MKGAFTLDFGSLIDNNNNNNSDNKNKNTKKQRKPRQSVNNKDIIMGGSSIVGINHNVKDDKSINDNDDDSVQLNHSNNTKNVDNHGIESNHYNYNRQAYTGSNNNTNLIMNNNNNNNNNNINNRQTVIRYNSTKQNANETFQAFVDKLIADGQYVNTKDIMHGLPHLHLGSIDSFRDIQEFNRKLDGVVSNYWISHSIRIYSELEKFVLSYFVRYLKVSPPPTSFQFFRMGNLFKHDKVIEYFKFYADNILTIQDLSNPTVDEIVSCSLLFLHKCHTSGNKDRTRFIVDSKVIEQFRLHLKKEFGRKLIGVSIYEDSLLRDLSFCMFDCRRALRSGKEEYKADYQRRIELSFDVLKNKTLHSSVIDPLGKGILMTQTSIDVNQLHATLSKVFSGLPSSFELMIDEICFNESSSLGISIVYDHIPDNYCNKCEYLVNEMMDEVTLMKSSMKKKSKDTIAATVVAFMMYLILHGEKKDNISGSSDGDVLTAAAVEGYGNIVEKGNAEEIESNSTETGSDTDRVDDPKVNGHDNVDLFIRTTLEEHVTSDIPSIVMEYLTSFVMSLFNSKFDFEVSSTITPRVIDVKSSIDWSRVRSEVHDVLQQQHNPSAAAANSKKKSSKSNIIKINRNKYLAISTILIIYTRLLNSMMKPAEMLEANSRADNNHQLSLDCLTVCVSSPLFLTEMTAMHAKIGYEGSILYLMQKLELNLKQELKVPALECSQLSQSFLVYILNVLASSATTDNSASSSSSSSSSSNPEQQQRSQQLRQMISGLFSSLQRELLQTNAHILHAAMDEDNIESDGHRDVELVDYHDYDSGFEEQTVVDGIIQRIKSYLCQLEFESTSSTAVDLLFSLTRFLYDLEQDVKNSPKSFSLLKIFNDLIDNDDDLKDRINVMLLDNELLVRSDNMDPRSSGRTDNVVDGVYADDGIEVKYESNDSQVSLLLVYCAVRKYLLGNSSTVRFDDRTNLLQFAFQYVKNEFSCRDSVLLKKTSQSIAQLKEEGVLRFAHDKIEIVDGQHVVAHKMIHFNPTQQLTRHSNDDEDGAIHRAYPYLNFECEYVDLSENLISLLLEVPFGYSCQEYLMWDDCGYASILNSYQQGDELTSIADFIIREDSRLAARSLDCKKVYQHIPYTTDFIALPSGNVNRDDCNSIKDSFRSGQLVTVASWLLASLLGRVDANHIDSCILESMLEKHEVLGSDVSDKLMSDVLTISFCLPAKPYHYMLLRSCFLILAKVTETSFDYLQSWSVEFATKENQHIGASNNSSNHRTFLKSLMIVGSSHPNEFTGLHLFSKQWLTTFHLGLITQTSLRGSSFEEELISSKEKYSAGQLNSLKSNANSDHLTNSIDAIRNNADLMGQPFGDDHDDDDVDDRVDTDDDALIASQVMHHTNESDKKQFIHTLLKSSFAFSQQVTDILKNTIEQLAENLYTHNVHFVMELIQNAEDNTYDGDVIPTVKLELYPHAVVVFNNEVGFSDKNIESVCSVNKSTKKGKVGYIGQKGIGFKSVFAVSDYPEVHSNGFHIKFDKSISYIEPIWIDETADYKWPSHYDSEGNYYETRLRLNLRDETMKNFPKLKKDIQDVFHGKLIIFMKKLQKMIYVDKITNYLIQHQRKDIGRNWIHIRTTMGSSSNSNASNFVENFWLILRDTFAPTLRRDKYAVEQSEVNIAFKFIKTGHKEKKQVHHHYSKRQVKKAKASKANVSYDDDYNNVDEEDDYDEDEDIFVEEIKLDFTDNLLPIYAFLPTHMYCYRFIIQADFLCATNRESIMENEWNQSLIQRVPALYLQFITEMANWIIRNENEDEDMNNALVLLSTEELISQQFPMLSQLNSTNYRLIIEPNDLLLSIPRYQPLAKDFFLRTNIEIYKGLQSTKFIKSQGGVWCCPTELVSIHHMPFDPLLYISEDLMLQATGRRYAIHSPGECELDDELCDVLGINTFDIKCVITCLEYISSSIATKRSGYDQTCQLEIVHKLAGVFLAIDLITRGVSQKLLFSTTAALPTKSSTSTYRNNLITPSRVIQRSYIQSNNINNNNSSVDKLHRNDRLDVEDIQKIRKMLIWPTKSNEFTTLDDGHILFIPTKLNLFNDAQQFCLEVFQDRIKLIDKRLFDAGDKYPFGAGALQKFLLANFRHTRSSTTVTAAVSTVDGGLEELSSDIIIRSVIIPVYKMFHYNSKGSETVDSSLVSDSDIDEEADAEVIDLIEDEPLSQLDNTNCVLDRITAAAFLAFIYLSDKETLKSIKETSQGVVVPVLLAKEKKVLNKTELLWKSRNVREPVNKVNLTVVKRFDRSIQASDIPALEVHLGVEFEDSSSSIAPVLIPTAFRQVNWTVVDPLVLAIIQKKFIAQADFEKFAVSSEYSTLNIRNLFSNNRSNDAKHSYKQFLLDIGVVDMFGVYTVPLKNSLTVQYVAPHLSKLIQHITRNGVAINTVQWNSDVDSSNVSENIPLFLPSSVELFKADNAIAPQVLSVSKDVHETLITISLLIGKEIKGFKQNKFKNDNQLLDDLCTFCWVPIIVHPQIQSNHYLICKPTDVISKKNPERERKPWLLGPHCVYLPERFYTQESVDQYRCLQSTFRLIAASTKETPPFDLLFNFVYWLTKQDSSESILSNINFMEWIYTEVCGYVDSNYCVGRDNQSDFFLGLMRSGSRIIWIPDDDRLSVVDYRSAPEYETGRMVSLRDLVREDMTKKLQFSDSPVKILSLYYSDKKELFSRDLYCYTCQAVEGMYGVMGKAASESQHTCMCRMSSSFAQLATTHGIQLVRRNPSSVDFAKVLLYYTKKIQNSMTTKLTSDEIDDLSAKANDILITLSINIWKCFRIKQSLHPYSSSQLQELKMFFQQNSLLPKKDDRTCFLSAADVNDRRRRKRMLICVDDDDGYSLFRDELTLYDDGIDWIAAQHDPSVGIFDEEDSQQNLDINQKRDKLLQELYDIEELKRDERLLLQLSGPEFNDKVHRISAETFFAPADKRALIDFLNIPKLSDYIKVNWEIDSEHIRLTKFRGLYLRESMNNLLYLSQLFLMTKGPTSEFMFSLDILPILFEQKRLLMLRKIIITECTSILKKVTLDLRDLNIKAFTAVEKELSVTYRQRMDSMNSSITLCISEAVKDSELQNLAINMVLKAIRVELALFTRNQHVELMKSLEAKLNQFCKYATNDFYRFLEHEFGIRAESNSINKWQLDVYTVEEVHDKADDNDIIKLDDELKDVEDKVNYQKYLEEKKLRKEEGKKKREARVKDAEHEQYLMNKALRVQELGQQCVTDTAVDKVVDKDDTSSAADRKANMIQFRDDLTSTTTIFEYDDVPSSLAVKTEGVDERDGRHVLSDTALRKIRDLKRDNNDDDSNSVDRQSVYSSGNTHNNSHIPRPGHQRDDSTQSHDSNHDDSSRNENRNSKDELGNSNGSHHHHSAGQNSSHDNPDSHLHFHDKKHGYPSHEEDNDLGHESHYPHHQSHHHPHHPRHNDHHMIPTDSSISPHDVLHIADNILLNSEVIIKDLDGLLSVEELKLISSTDVFQNPQGFSMSGRIGEQLAFEYLSSFVAQDASWKDRVIDIKWMNRDDESGGPYDIMITLVSGEIKYCEVKTRLVRRTAVPDYSSADLTEPIGSFFQLQTQWPISPLEISEAVHRSTSYCCMLLNIYIDQPHNSVHVLSVRMLGFTDGLVRSIYSNQANLLIQIT